MGRGRREAGRDSCVVFCDISNVPFVCKEKLCVR
jgi:hypothetical protein